ncbi:MAG: tetratricopeptide repeat protein [Candidatus Halichondribacter symbioticus]
MDDFEKGVVAYKKKDFGTAVSLLTPLAESGHPGAQYNLALLYANGKGVPQDYKEAAKWYTLSAEQGAPLAQNNLGLMYDEGLGIPQNYVLAHMWYNLAASNGSELAPGNRNGVAKKMTPEQIGKAQDLARKCLANNYQGY